MNPNAQQPPLQQNPQGNSPLQPLGQQQTVKKPLNMVLIVALLIVFALVIGGFIYTKLSKNTVKTTTSTQSPTTCGTAACDTSLNDATTDKIISTIKDQSASWKLKEYLDGGKPLTDHYAVIDITANGVKGYTSIKATTGASFGYQDSYDFSNSKGKENDDSYCTLAKADLSPVGNFIEKCLNRQDSLERIKVIQLPLTNIKIVQMGILKCVAMTTVVSS
jgi:hypothetical protein